MKDFLVSLITDILNMSTNIGVSLTDTPETFNKTIYDTMINLQNNVIMPVALVILSIFLLIELHSVSQRIGENGTRGFELPFRVMIKAIFCKVLLDSTNMILLAISKLGSELTIKINSIFQEASIDLLGSDKIKELVDATNFFDQIGLLAVVLIVFVIVKLGSIAITIMIYGRMIQMYIYTAIAPIPVATTPNNEHSSIAKNFLKNYAAICLQGILIVIAVGISATMIHSFIKLDMNEVSMFSLTSYMWQCAGYNILTLTMVFGTGRLSKSILNAM